MGKQGPCNHCGVTSTPLWRNGPPEKPVLCNACGSRWRTRGSLENYMPMHAGGLGLGASGKWKAKKLSMATEGSPAADQAEGAPSGKVKAVARGKEAGSGGVTSGHSPPSQQQASGRGAANVGERRKKKTSVNAPAVPGGAATGKGGHARRDDGETGAGALSRSGAGGASVFGRPAALSGVFSASAVPFQATGLSPASSAAGGFGASPVLCTQQPPPHFSAAAYAQPNASRAETFPPITSSFSSPSSSSLSYSHQHFSHPPHYGVASDNFSGEPMDFSCSQEQTYALAGLKGHADVAFADVAFSAVETGANVAAEGADVAMLMTEYSSSATSSSINDSKDNSLSQGDDTSEDENANYAAQNSRNANHCSGKRSGEAGKVRVGSVESAENSSLVSPLGNASRRPPMHPSSASPGTTSHHTKRRSATSRFNPRGGLVGHDSGADSHHLNSIDEDLSMDPQDGADLAGGRPSIPAECDFDYYHKINDHAPGGVGNEGGGRGACYGPVSEGGNRSGKISFALRQQPLPSNKRLQTARGISGNFRNRSQSETDLTRLYSRPGYARRRDAAAAAAVGEFPMEAAAGAGATPTAVAGGAGPGPRAGESAGGIQHSTSTQQSFINLNGEAAGLYGGSAHSSVYSASYTSTTSLGLANALGELPAVPFSQFSENLADNAALDDFGTELKGWKRNLYIARTPSSGMLQSLGITNRHCKAMLYGGMEDQEEGGGARGEDEWGEFDHDWRQVSQTSSNLNFNPRLNHELNFGYGGRKGSKLLGLKGVSVLASAGATSSAAAIALESDLLCSYPYPYRSSDLDDVSISCLSTVSEKDEEKDIPHGSGATIGTTGSTAAGSEAVSVAAGSEIGLGTGSGVSVLSQSSEMTHATGSVGGGSVPSSGFATPLHVSPLSSGCSSLSSSPSLARACSKSYDKYTVLSSCASLLVDVNLGDVVNESSFASLFSHEEKLLLLKLLSSVDLPSMKRLVQTDSDKPSFHLPSAGDGSILESESLQTIFLTFQRLLSGHVFCDCLLESAESEREGKAGVTTSFSQTLRSLYKELISVSTLDLKSSGWLQKWEETLPNLNYETLSYLQRDKLQNFKPKPKRRLKKKIAALPDLAPEPAPASDKESAASSKLAKPASAAKPVGGKSRSKKETAALSTGKGSNPGSGELAETANCSLEFPDLVGPYNADCDPLDLPSNPSALLENIGEQDFEEMAKYFFPDGTEGGEDALMRDLALLVGGSEGESERDFVASVGGSAGVDEAGENGENQKRGREAKEAGVGAVQDFSAAKTEREEERRGKGKAGETETTRTEAKAYGETNMGSSIALSFSPPISSSTASSASSLAIPFSSTLPPSSVSTPSSSSSPSETNTPSGVPSSPAFPFSSPALPRSSDTPLGFSGLQSLALPTEQARGTLF